LHEQFDLVIVAEETRKPAGFSLAVAVSLVVHALLIFLFLTAYNTAPPASADVPIARYVQLIKQNPQQFVEAPGPEVASAPLTAPLSDKNRKASIQQPTGATPTNRPGDGRDIYTPPSGGGSSTPQPAQRAQQAQEAREPRQAVPGRSGDSPLQQPAVDTSTFAFRESRETSASASAASAMVDWRQAIREVKPSAGGGGALNASNVSGGELGSAEQGPLSFESQWFDWGPYAQSMVSRIRVNWYANMPQLIRTGIAGVVTVRFTIQRDGRISEVTVLESSGHPPYDFAARKAIELSSPLNPLPANFPNPNERVTAKFFYNKPIG
jgi:TonB family protein